MLAQHAHLAASPRTGHGARRHHARIVAAAAGGARPQRPGAHAVLRPSAAVLVWLRATVIAWVAALAAADLRGWIAFYLVTSTLGSSRNAVK